VGEVRPNDAAAHGFFNYKRGDGTAYTRMVRAADAFIESLGFLAGEPTIDDEQTPTTKPTTPAAKD